MTETSNTPHTPLLSGLRGFTIVMLGQVFSLLGTSMSGFALQIWAYERTGQATALALVGFFFVTPMLIVSPLAGALVDRSNRKLMMMISDLCAGIGTLIIMILYHLGVLDIWHLYLTSAIMGVGQAFQWPAFSAAVTTMVSKEQYGRANGMISLAETGSGVFAPVLAAALLGTIGLGGILIIDLSGLTIAILALLVVSVPQPKVTAVGAASQGSLAAESIYGLKYILRYPSLLGLQLVFMLGNFVSGVAMTLAAPMVLARTGNDSLALGSVNSIGAVGGIIGGLLMSAWGGTKRKVHGVLIGWALTGLFTTLLMGLGRSVLVWGAATFIGGLIVPWLNGSNQAIWQAKVAPDVQGRVFSIRRLIAWISSPLAALIAGPLADKVMEPAMSVGGALEPRFSWLVGSGPGAGMALVFVFAGAITTFIGLGGYLFRPIRDAELILPDHDELTGGGVTGGGVTGGEAQPAAGELPTVEA
ncbi:MAG: MFS transporter [Chloroflexota bacterium]